MLERVNRMVSEAVNVGGGHSGEKEEMRSRGRKRYLTEEKGPISATVKRENLNEMKPGVQKGKKGKKQDKEREGGFTPEEKGCFA